MARPCYRHSYYGAYVELRSRHSCQRLDNRSEVRFRGSYERGGAVGLDALLRKDIDYANTDLRIFGYVSLLTGDAISATNTSLGPAPMQKISFGLTFG